jgi:hypothetical protein
MDASIVFVAAAVLAGLMRESSAFRRLLIAKIARASTLLSLDPAKWCEKTPDMAKLKLLLQCFGGDAGDSGGRRCEECVEESRVRAGAVIRRRAHNARCTQRSRSSAARRSIDIVASVRRSPQLRSRSDRHSHCHARIDHGTDVSILLTTLRRTVAITATSRGSKLRYPTHFFEPDQYKS